MLEEGRLRYTAPMLIDSSGDPIRRVEGGEPAESLALKALEEDWGEFLQSDSFDPAWVRSLIRAGFLPMGLDWCGERLLLPKLHRRRSLLDWADLRICRSVRSAARRYRLVVDRDFHGTLTACVERHGDDWLTERLQSLFLELHANPSPGLRLLSFELFPDGPDGGAETPTAGEIGYACGASYTSLSGYFRESGSGTVQLLATGCLLALSGFAYWDLGMPMDYKGALGARSVERGAFLERLGAARDLPIPDLGLRASMNARDLIDEYRASTSPASHLCSG